MQLPNLAAAEEVTLMNTVPTAIAELLRFNGIPSSVRIVNLAGEPLPDYIVDKLYQKPGIQRVFDLYGPTETTTYSTFASRECNGPATIGRPVNNALVYLLDAYLNPVPIGVSGELYIGGAGVARGYLNRPSLTAERFLHCPFSYELDARMYKTGDIGRYLPDGNIEFLGRNDDQVKIRGFRIELGEIEATLRQYPNVEEVVVLAREDSPGDKTLAAYVVWGQGGKPGTRELRRLLQEKLPDYMMPGAFVTLDTLPQTPSGKVDRLALPAPDKTGPERESNFVAPRYPLEEALAGIWSEVLGLDLVGIHDNFFDLGGHSLLATRVIARILRTFGVDLPLRSLFETHTVAELATVITRKLAKELGQKLIAPL